MSDRDILSTRLENRAQVLTMIARGEVVMKRAELRAMLHEMATNLRDDARAVGRLERERGRSV
jgi:hypothetical protein